ncbi:MAG: hypothetical protein A3G84_06790 [Chloroflexi bacterium RIFCSPLOWO2_12_FULL_71_12]|nr:MAG: hypothetical protein A2082_06670 [Chloroflexi bacterium GWC2_70_10]OGO69723.1 MAG: hypothetical protein A3H36_02580 [Chloroflexi bacterium RIFCSPLOWO2_02_FULL_71_16]OGO74319.1 MAG: hypothetical protein A3G84_06790 [Chloroflexi bacterium RIFCSPLOWO2_12_FULL_71_12]
MSEGQIADTAIEFIAFCFERSQREWPKLYDEMCNVASKRLYKGLGYDELKDAGVDLTFSGMAKMSRIAREITREVRARRPELAVGV